MPDEVNTSAPAEKSPEPAPVDVVPNDFREYVKWRTTGEPAPETKQEETPAAAEETPQAKTAPDSEPDNTPQEPEEEESDDESSEEEPAGHKRPGSRQRRIDRLTREKEDLAQENEDLKRRIAEREQEKPPPAKKADDEGRPKLEDFPTLQDYMRADMEWLHARESAKHEQSARVAKVQSEWDAKEKDARKAHPDYEDVVYSVKVPEGPGVMAARHAMLEDAAGAEILYYLAKRPQDMKRIAALDPINAVKEIGRISAIIEASSAVPENNVKRITSAPKPPPDVRRPARTSTDDINDPEVQQDFPRWERLRKAELGRR